MARRRWFKKSEENQAFCPNHWVKFERRPRSILRAALFALSNAASKKNFNLGKPQQLPTFPFFFLPRFNAPAKNAKKRHSGDVSHGGGDGGGNGNGGGSSGGNGGDGGSSGGSGGREAK